MLICFNTKLKILHTTFECQAKGSVSALGNALRYRLVRLPREKDKNISIVFRLLMAAGYKLFSMYSIKTLVVFRGLGYALASIFCGNDEIGKHDGFKYHRFGLWVQTPLPALNKKSFLIFLKIYSIIYM